MHQVLETGQAIHDLELHGPPSPRYKGTHDWLINLYPVPGADGEITGVGVTLTDLTQRKHAEAALHQSEARFAKAFHSSPVGLAINRISDGCFLDVNESFLHLIGYTHAEIVGKSWQTLEIFGDPGIIGEIEFQIHSTGRVQNQQIILRTKHGKLRTVLFSAEPLVLEQQECFISTCVNITERVRAQELVRRTADRLATIRGIDQAILKLHAPATIANAVVANIRTLIPCQHASVMLYDPASAQAQILTFWSELPVALPINQPFPLQADELPDGFLHGAPWIAPDLLNDVTADHTHPMLAAITPAPIGALLSIPLLVEWQMIGTLNLAATQPGAFTDEHVTIAQEIGDMLAIALHNARLVESLQQELAARARAEIALTTEHARVVRLKNEFMATMSHELRTPLAAVLGRSELLIEGVYESLNERQMVAMQTIAQSGKHLLTLINDILDYAKFESGQIALVLSETMVAKSCRDSVSLIGQAALAKQIALTVTLDAAVITIMADRRRLQQILVNLLENAIKFTPKGGEVGLEVHGDSAHEQAIFTVWDTGIGIAEADLPQLFQPFTQLDSGLSRQYEGTGLGLALVRRLTEAHNGSVTVTSTPKIGSRFSVTLPWHSSVAGAEQPTEPFPMLLPVVDRIERSKGASSSPAPLILLVEDRESNIAVLEDALPPYGYQVVVARDGLVALMRARETRPALILMDIQLPGLSGIDVIQQIRADPHLRQIPIIALTALVLPGDRERCLDAGADEYLAKPVSLRMLLATIAARLAHT
jgi:PAS domain S-box-containing protein